MPSREETSSTRFRYLAPALAFWIPFLVYLVTTPSDLTDGLFGSDNGELITAAVTGGVPHPPGYPTWMLAARTFNLLPIGETIAHRFNLFSAICMSAAMLFLFLTIQKALDNKYPIPALATVAAVAFNLTVWSQAVITEVYALNSLLLASALFVLCKLEFDTASNRLVFVAGLLTGLAATTHLTSVFLLPLIALVLRQRLKLLPLAGVGFAVGLLPFALLFLGGAPDSPIVWGEPETLSGWWWLVSGEIYRANVLALSAAEVLERVRPFFQLSQIEPSLLIPIGGFMGLALAFFEPDHRSRLLFPTGLAAVALLYAVYALSYDTGDWRVFLLPFNLFMALPLAYGLSQFDNLSLLVPLLFLLVNFPILRDAQANTVRPDALQLFEQAPENAILITDGRDRTLFPIWYFRYAENMRPDTIVVDYNLTAFDWYRDRLSRQHPDLQGLERDDLNQFRALNQDAYPICEISLQPFALSCPDG